MERPYIFKKDRLICFDTHVFRFDKPKSFEIDKSASTEDDDVFEEEESTSIPLKDLFLLQLPDEQNFLVFYSNGRKAISKTSNGYIALFDNVSQSVRRGPDSPVQSPNSELIESYSEHVQVLILESKQ